METFEKHPPFVLYKAGLNPSYKLDTTEELKNPAVPLEQWDGESPKFKEELFIISSLANPAGLRVAWNRLAVNFQLDSLNLVHILDCFVFGLNITWPSNIQQMMHLYKPDGYKGSYLFHE